ncbi:MAG: TonB-dependent receptor [Bacteroidia bacterium]
MKTKITTLKTFKAAKFILLGFFLSGFSFKNLAQTAGKQTVRGSIIDNDSKQPLIGATVTILNGEIIGGATTDAEGKFRIANVPLGRKTIKVSYIGYENLVLPDIMVTAGKEVVLNLGLSEQVNKMQEVTVTYSRKTDPTVTNNEMAVVSSRSFNPDDTKKYAGALGDPSRMAANFAGVISGNDSRNDIVVRGNSPNAMLWQLEGVNIFNPNHFGSNFNTGGPVSILNANNIAKSDFFTGAFPAQYGNANGGVFDLVLREGNNEKHELLAQIGFNGFEIGAEGPLSKKSKASYIFNYRYSTLAVMKEFGFNVGTGAAVPLYQDMNFKVAVPLKNKSKLTWFGMGGISSIDLLAKDVDTNGVDFYGDVNQNQFPRYSKFMTGLALEKNLTEKTWAKFTLAWQHTNDGYKIDSLNLSNESVTYRKAKGTFVDNKYSAILNVNHKFNAKNTLHAGINHDVTFFNYSNIDYFNKGTIDTVRIKRNGNINLTQAYAQLKHRFSAKFSANIGLHAQYLDANNKAVLEPRAGIRFAIDENSSINAGYGLHHQTIPLYNMFSQDEFGNEPNKKLNFMRSNHFVVGYERTLTRHTRLKFETYYQLLSQIPVHTFSSSFSMLNVGAAFAPVDETKLANEGSGTNYGIELTLERNFNKGYYFLVTGSLFDSKYKGSDGVERNTAFNSKYAANILAGKEFKLGNKGDVIYANIKFTTLGGRYFTPVDLAASAFKGFVVFDDSRAFSVQQTPYLRSDIKIGWRKDFSKSSMEFAIDFQNVTNHKNIFAQNYNPRTNSIANEYQQGFFPVPMFRYTF